MNVFIHGNSKYYDGQNPLPLVLMKQNISDKQRASLEDILADQNSMHYGIINHYTNGMID